MPPELSVIEPFAVDLADVLAQLEMPAWAPWPIPAGWCFAGCAHCRPGPRGADAATVTSWMGDDPFGDPVETLLVCEEAGSTVGGHFGDLATSYPPSLVGQGPPHAKLHVEGRSADLWSVATSSDRSVYAGEAAGRWLWMVMHPAAAGAIVLEPLHLVDIRTLGAELALLPLGELSPRLLVD